jgi:hypothetical protein
VCVCAHRRRRRVPRKQTSTAVAQGHTTPTCAWAHPRASHGSVRMLLPWVGDVPRLRVHARVRSPKFCFVWVVVAAFAGLPFSVSSQTKNEREKTVLSLSVGARRHLSIPGLAFPPASSGSCMLDPAPMRHDITARVGDGLCEQSVSRRLFPPLSPLQPRTCSACEPAYSKSEKETPPSKKETPTRSIRLFEEEFYCRPRRRLPPKPTPPTLSRASRSMHASPAADSGTKGGSKLFSFVPHRLACVPVLRGRPPFFFFPLWQEARSPPLQGPSLPVEITGKTKNPNVHGRVSVGRATMANAVDPDLSRPRR